MAFSLTTAYRPMCITLAVIILGACEDGTAPSSRLAVKPTCALNWVISQDIAGNSPSLQPQFSPSRTWRLDATVGSGFERPQGPEGLGRGNGIVGLNDVAAFDEAWFQHALAPQMVQVQVLRASAGGSRLPDEYEWVVQARDAMGTLSAVFGRANLRGPGQRLRAEVAAEALPQLMPVGTLTPQMFACTGGLSEDSTVDTTLLYEIVPPGQTVPAGISLVQDVLSGDSRFVPNAVAGPLRGPPSPPAPRISGPGKQVETGIVKCAMIQQDDDAASRELHVIAMSNGTLLHSMASNFSPAASDNGRGATFQRFNSVSTWQSVTQTLGADVGRITSAAIAATGPRSISVYFVAERGGLYKLFHTARISPSGTWTPPEDVFALNGTTPVGSVYDYRVSANVCPPMDASANFSQDAEHLITLQGSAPDPYSMPIIRRTPDPREWLPGVVSRYSPFQVVRLYMGSYSEGQAANVRISQVRVTTRAFDRYAPPP